MSDTTLSNVLAHSASPYLLQHRDNPVHWQVWGDSALIEAKRSGKPILLSIGYAACHWCHVMAHESFEDPDTAAVMNALFVNIKVDREERSDIDQIYMAALHAMGEQGGWPLTMFLNADAEPFWGGTYFPKTAAYGSPDFVTVLRTIANLYHSEPDKITRNVTAIRAHLEQTLSASGDSTDPSAPDRLQQSGHRHPVHHRPPPWRHRPGTEISQRQHARNPVALTGEPPPPAMPVTPPSTGCAPCSRAASTTTSAAACARYSVDARWLVPHFEKMLYDNAQLIRALAWAFTETPADSNCFEPESKRPSTGCAARCCCRAAPSHPVWTPTAKARRGVSMSGARKRSKPDARSGSREPSADFLRRNTGRQLGRQRTSSTASHTRNCEMHLSRTSDLADCRQRQEAAEARARRVRPGRDDKVLADWNGLMIRSGRGRAGAILTSRHWINIGQGAYGFVTRSMMDERRACPCMARRDRHLSCPRIRLRCHDQRRAVPLPGEAGRPFLTKPVASPAFSTSTITTG